MMISTEDQAKTPACSTGRGSSLVKVARAQGTRCTAVTAAAAGMISCEPLK
jgi:hypothetical protein